MQWEKPQSIEIPLAFEIGSYANAELSVSPALEQAEAVSAAEG
jgi:coenzyme PQQ precursor peptide PqqA